MSVLWNLEPVTWIFSTASALSSCAAALPATPTNEAALNRQANLTDFANFEFVNIYVSLDTVNT